MSSPTPDQFDEFYQAVYGYAPFPWQIRLAKRVCSGQDWPRAIALPTAAGKTTCIDIAVFALACGVKAAPRRILFVVDRRIVVDQAERHAKGLADKLKDAKGSMLKCVADSLRQLAQDVRPLDVYALRGGMYRETAWARSPLQPTVIASTVDQVGSRLLFRGYGVSDSMKPVHAALVGNDALILLDEAHCAKPFEQTAEAVKKYRLWNESPVPFHFVSVTATPTSNEGLFEIDLKADLKNETFAARYNSKKPAKLVVAEKAKGKKFTAELVKELKKQAEELAKKYACVGIIVNRVRTARELKATLGEDAVLLTGRMRPLDRDRLFEEKLKPLLSNAEGTSPKFVIGTQCLEVGADFDFHALVTECASLDALRQRFGRLNRVAKRKDAEAVVLIRGDQTDGSTDDPIYGASLGETWKWLKSQTTDDVFDFGVAAVRETLEGISDDERKKLLDTLNAPAPDAPVLFPAHLDCWVQTNPIPHPDPDVAVFLHGPKQTGQPDVQVVLRNDLGDDPDKWAEVVAMVPPSSSEAVAVPIGVFKKWLAGETPDDNTGDIEGGITAEDDTDDEGAIPRQALCWQGAEADETDIIRESKDVKPNRTYVVSCSAPEVGRLADFITDPPQDYAEEAFQKSRDKPVLRLRDLELDEEDEEFETKLTDAVTTRLKAEFPHWDSRAVDALTHVSKRDYEKYPEGVIGYVVKGKWRIGKQDPTYLDDSEPGESFKGRSVTLTDHSRGVAEHVVRFARGCRFSDEDVTRYQQAGFYHDLGKLDLRFQAMLKQGSPRTAVGLPLAKSAKGPRTKPERDAAREVHRYPAGARHELLSAAVLTNHADDLLLYLIATHHGSARPFADPVDENDAVKAPFSGEMFGLKFSVPSSRQDIATWNAELPERFWRMVRKYGWWGSAFREAVFRLADHAQSRAEQEKEWAPAKLPDGVPPSPLAPYTESRRLYPLPLPGIDGANPLAFLAALGTLRLANKAFRGSRLSWALDGVWTPTLHLPEQLTPEELTSVLLAQAAVGRRSITFAPDVKILASIYQGFEREAVQVSRDDREFADFIRAYADPLVTIQGGPNAGKTKPTEFYFIAGQQKLLKQVAEIAMACDGGHLTKCLFSSWLYGDPLDGLSLRWDPLDDLRYATRWRNPSKDSQKGKRGSVLGANRLAFEALPLFPCFAIGERLTTTGFATLDRSPHFTWPIWTAAWSVDAVRSVLATVEPPRPRGSIQKVRLPRQLGVRAWYQCEKVPNSDYSNFAPSQVVD